MCICYVHRNYIYIYSTNLRLWYIVNKRSKTIFFFNIYLEKNNSWPRVFYTRGNIWTRVKIHASNWTRVFYTRVQINACIKYTCPIGRVYFYTHPIGRVD
jgi:hypothetical protein